MRLLLFLLFLFAICTAHPQYPTPVKSVSELDNMVRNCFQTLCKEWMHECHWYCDAIKGPSFYRRCRDCLSWRGANCMDCFEL